MNALIRFVTVTLVAWALGSYAETADLVIVGGKVITVEAAAPEAEAIAVRDGRIVAVGDRAEVDAWRGENTIVIDLEGRVAVPGFIEGHGHFLSLGRSRMILDLNDVESWDEIVDLVGAAAEASEPGAWIQGRGWHQEKWREVPDDVVDGVPRHDSLSAVSPENPVLLGHASGHAAFANERALARAGISVETDDPAGGTIVRDSTGRATGLLPETAATLVSRVLAAELATRSEAQRATEFARQVELAGEEALAHGVTSFHDAGVAFAAVDRMIELDAQGCLPVRLYVMLSEGNEALARNLERYRRIGDFLTIRSIKRVIDGALGSHGAWLLAPYADMPESTGLATISPDVLAETARLADLHGFQLATHAIGDRGNREVLDVYEDAFDTDVDDRRWRIEHAQHLHPDDVVRFAELDVIASMQAIHAASDAPWVLRRLGPERAESGAYLWRSLLDAGVVVTNGSDVPVEPISPIDSLYAAIVRNDREGNPFFPGEAMTRAEAIESYTLSNAYAAFEEDQKGSIAVGKLADVAILDRDITSVSTDEIAATAVDMTIVDGVVRFVREGQFPAIEAVARCQW